MSFFFRALITFVAAVAAFYMTLWLIGPLILPDSTPQWAHFLLSLAAAVVVGQVVWVRTAGASAGLAGAAVTGGLVVGGIGFCAGFFGPMVFAPQANQGPLLGIFITGPLGFVVGAVGGGIYWLVRHRGST